MLKKILALIIINGLKSFRISSDLPGSWYGYFLDLHINFLTLIDYFVFQLKGYPRVTNCHKSFAKYFNHMPFEW